MTPTTYYTPAFISAASGRILLPGGASLMRGNCSDPNPAEGDRTPGRLSAGEERVREPEPLRSSDGLVSMRLSRSFPTGPTSRANLRTPGNMWGKRRGGPLLTRDPPVRNG